MVRVMTGRLVASGNRVPLSSLFGSCGRAGGRAKRFEASTPRTRQKTARALSRWRGEGSVRGGSECQQLNMDVCATPALHDISLLSVVLHGEGHGAPVGGDGHVVCHMWVAGADAVLFRLGALRSADGAATLIVHGMSAVAGVGVCIIVHGPWRGKGAVVRRRPAEGAHVRGSIAATRARLLRRRLHGLGGTKVGRVRRGGPLLLLWLLLLLLGRARVVVQRVAIHASGRLLARLALLEVGTHVRRQRVLVLGEVSVVRALPLHAIGHGRQFRIGRNR